MEAKEYLAALLLCTPLLSTAQSLDAAEKPAIKVGQVAIYITEERADKRTSEDAHQASASEEASFLLSSVLEAFAACVEHLERAQAGGPSLEVLRAFKGAHSQIYGADSGGRDRQLFKAHVVPAGGKSTSAVAYVDRVFRQGPKLSTSKSGRRATDLRSQDEYQVFVQVGKEMVRGLDYVESHLALLRDLHAGMAGGG